MLLGLITGPITHAQTTPAGPQQLVFAGLRAGVSQGLPAGQINAVQVDAHGDLYLLLDQRDGVRVLKTDAAASTVLAQAQIGAGGDIGTAMALDPAGEVYVTGTTSSGALTATSGAAFLTASGPATNSFVAKFDNNLNTVFVSFAGGGFMAASAISATADAVFVAGSIFAPTLPVTPGGIIQAPAHGSSGNGFVERFSASGATLVYATYLSGADGSTTAAAIVADAADEAYVAGNTSSPGYPTVAALVPASPGATAGFLTRLTPLGDGIGFSTFVPGAGVTSLALDAPGNSLLLSGGIALGQFPVTNVPAPLAATPYQVLVRMSLNGSSVLQSTVVAPGTQSYVAADANGVAWIAGSLAAPGLPLATLQGFGTGFAARVTATGTVDRAVRLGGLALESPANASAPVQPTSLAVDATGEVLIGGSFQPSASAGLLAGETFDLPLFNAPTTAFPSLVRAAVLPVSACNGSLCPGSAAYLAKVAPTAGTALALSVDDAPNGTLRNLGSAQATDVQLAASGFSFATDCGATLAAGAECTVQLSGSGPGLVTVSAANSASQTASVSALTASPQPVVFSPKQLDFGLVSAAAGTASRTITVTNLSSTSQTFTSLLDANAKVATPYTIAETASDCTIAGAATKVLAAGGVCHITLGLTASSAAANDGAIAAQWKVGARDLPLAAWGQAAGLSLSAATVDFGTQYAGGPRSARGLFLSNVGAAAVSHAAVTLPTGSPFSVVDGCPAVLEPGTVCGLQFGYRSAAATSSDAVTLTLDQGLTALVKGKTIPQPGSNGASVNPNLTLSTTAISFDTAVPVTGLSGGTQTVTVGNTGATSFALALALTGDFTDTTSCGAVLAAGATCSVVVTFAPSAPGTRAGLLSVTAGAGSTPAYVALSGVGTGILSPANNGELDFGLVIAGQPVVQWYKVTQAFTGLTAATSGGSFGVVVVEDIGYGHGAPARAAFAPSAAGSCFNCWVGVQFTPGTLGAAAGTLSLATVAGGSAYSLALTGVGLPPTGLLLSPAVADFGPTPVNSTSASQTFVVTNLVSSGAAVGVSAPSVTGDFTLSNAVTGGAACAGSLAYGASCFVTVSFAPTAGGTRAGTLSVAGGSGGNATVASAALTGYGSPDPGVALDPTALIFANVPGATANAQTVTVTNTSGATLTLGTLTASTTAPTAAAPSFQAASGCAGALSAGASCSVSVTFTPGTGPVSGVLTVPVTTAAGGASSTTNLSVPLTGGFSTENAGLQIVAAEVQYGPQPTGELGVTRQFTINNLTAKAMTLSVGLPRQYVLSGAPCAALAPAASCSFSVSFLPLTNGDVTGTLFAVGTPADGSATLNGLGYVEGYGVGAGSLAVAGGLLPGQVLNFGQVPSGQPLSRVLTLTNASTSLPLTVRRVTSEWPFLTTTTCGETLAPGALCTVAVTYSPLNQVVTGTVSPAQGTDAGTLVIESDAASSPDLIDLAGTSLPVAVGTPSNTAPLAVLVATPSSLAFTSTQVGSASVPQTVTLANAGTATLQITSLTATPDFTVTSGCGVGEATIVPGGSCDLTVTFTPQNSTVPGTLRTSAIEIGSDASSSLDFVSLVGSSLAATLTLSANALDFGTVDLPGSATLPLSVTNTAATAATLIALTTTGDYSVAAGTCPASGATLAAGATCTAQVTFAPTAAGVRAGTLTLASSATTLPLTVPLTGIGAQSHLEVAPVTLGFGAIAVGSTSALSLTLANTGTAAISGVHVTATGDYTVSVPCAVTALAAGGSCSVTVTFAPTAAGVRNGTLTVVSSDPDSPAAVALSGTGFVAGTFSLTVSGASTASATVKSGIPASYSLNVTPINGFTGTVVLNCSPTVAAEYVFCSLLPSSVAIGTGAVGSTATLSTVTSVAAAATPHGPGRYSFQETALGLLLPACFIRWKTRRTRRLPWRRAIALAWVWFAAIALLTASGCGGGGATPANTGLLYATPGTYQYQVTATSVGAATPSSQTVTLNLIVQ